MDTENIKKMQLSDLMRRLKAYPPQEFEFRLALEHTTWKQRDLETVCSRLLKLYQMKTRIVNRAYKACYALHSKGTASIRGTDVIR